MTAENVTASLGDGSASVTFPFDFGDSIPEANEKFGEGIVWAYARRALVIAAQGYARTLVKGGKSEAEILELMKAWKPGEPRKAKSAEDKVRDLLSKMSPEDREKLQKELRGGGAEVAKKAKTV